MAGPILLYLLAVGGCALAAMPLCRLAFGDVRWSLGFNWNKTTIEGTRDTPGALELVEATREALDQAGITVKTP